MKTSFLILTEGVLIFKVQSPWHFANTLRNKTWKIHSFSDIYLEFAIFQKHENCGVKQIDKCLLEIVEFRFSTDTATKRFNFQKRFQYHSHFRRTIIVI